MDCYFIYCPYSEKNEAKALGARWNKKEKRWYAADQTTYAALAKWHKPKTVFTKPISKHKPIKVVAESVPVRGLDQYKPWEQTGESEEDYNARQGMGSYYKGVWGGVPSVYQHRMMQSGVNLMSTAFDTRGD
jgi:hypothetical protein